MARPTKTSTAQNVTMATARPRRGTFHRCRPTTSGLSSRATKPDTAINRTTSRSRYRSLPAIKVTTTTATVTRIARSGMPCDSVDRHRRARRVCDGVLSGINQAWQVHDGGGQRQDPQAHPPQDPREAGDGGYFSNWRAMTTRWIWLVPSYIWVIFASRIIRSTG